MNPHNKKQLYNSQVSPQLSSGGHTVDKKKIFFILKMGTFRWVKYSAILGGLLNLAALIIKTFIGLHGAFLPDELTKNVS